MHLRSVSRPDSGSDTETREAGAFFPRIHRRERRHTTLKDWEAILIVDAVRRHDGNRAAAAKELEINPSTLYRKAKSLNIELPKAAGRDKSD